ncbi:MAG: DUF4339 domain-containing protein [Verrucomicrobia bacterium]|nr:DUF4339 domain-containing protein [Verrucomicrobiota bacterium]
MRLFEAILNANHRALAGDTKAGLHPDEFAGSLPVVALTCIDPRLNPLIPEVLGVREEHFIWLRNAGNIITGPLSSTMRSLALACAVKGGKEIAIVGHTDCLVAKTTMLQLIERFREEGVERSRLPENLNDFFGIFASERQNVIKAVDIVRQSPLIGPKVPVHGLLVDIASGKLDWLVNGYETLGAVAAGTPAKGDDRLLVAAPLNALPDFQMGDLKFPELKIGEVAVGVKPVSEPVEAREMRPLQPAGPAEESKPTEGTLRQSFQLDPARKFKIIGSDQKTYGPVAGFKLLQWIADGRIDWQTPARAEGSSEWRPLSAWTASPAPATVPTPPRIQTTTRSKRSQKPS